MSVIWWLMSMKRKRIPSRCSSPRSQSNSPLSGSISPRSRSNSPRSRSNSRSLHPAKRMRIDKPRLESILNHRGSRTSLQGPPEFFRFCYRINSCVEDNVTTFMVKIRSDVVDELRDMDLSNYNRHHHLNHSDTFRFRCLKHPPKYMLSEHLTPYSTLAAVKDVVYMLFYNEFHKGHEFRSLNITNRAMDFLQAPIAPNRGPVKSLSLRDKIYFLGCFRVSIRDDFDPMSPQPFGEVYDPDTKCWSPLKQPPNVATLICSSKIFVASLGESEGKIMIYHYDTTVPEIYIYDVVVDKWIFHEPDPAFGPIFKPQFIYGNEVVNEDDGNIYWLDERKGDIYALDLVAKRVYHGPIVGMEHVSILQQLHDCASGFVLHHLWSDIFCFQWSSSVLDGCEVSTDNHFTFMRIIKDSDDNTLTSFVLGCFMDREYREYDIQDAIRV